MKLNTKYGRMGLLISNDNGHGFYLSRAKSEAEGLEWLESNRVSAEERIREIEIRMSGMENYSKRFGTASE
jgi:hypothetical protein